MVEQVFTMFTTCSIQHIFTTCTKSTRPAGVNIHLIIPDNVHESWGWCGLLVNNLGLNLSKGDLCPISCVPLEKQVCFIWIFSLVVTCPNQVQCDTLYCYTHETAHRSLSYEYKVWSLIDLENVAQVMWTSFIWLLWNFYGVIGKWIMTQLKF